MAKNDDVVTTQEKIANFCDLIKIDKRVFSPWSDLLKKVEDLDGGEHGTALFLLDLGRELSLLTDIGDMSKDNIEFSDIQRDLVDTLRAFVNPYFEIKNSFSYEIYSIKKNGYKRQILNPKDVFGNSDFDALEHTVVGEIDAKGWFRGRVKAFGECKGNVVVPPNISIDEKSGVGAFNIKIGTFEFLYQNSTLTEREHASFLDKAAKYSGLMIFRDDLRVLPYGRVDNDFFQIEERRSLNAGRYYWSNRRTFGQIGISQDNNKELKDKSGREGFIRNQAARQLKILVSDLLTNLADKFFGSRSEERKELLDMLKREKEQRKAAQQLARKSTQKSFYEALKKQSPILDESLNKIVHLKKELEAIDKLDINSIREIDVALSELDSLRTEIKTPTKPAKLGIYEEKYRDYRDKYNEFSAYVLQLKLVVNKLDSALNKLEPGQLAKRHLEKNQGIINSKLSKFSSTITETVDKLIRDWGDNIKNDRSIYYRETIFVVEGVENGGNVEQALNTLDTVYLELIDSLTFKYHSIIKGLEKLSEGVNLESAFSLSEEERSYFEEKARSLNALAQLGISVEIISHELEEMDALVTRGLNSLPTSAKEHPGFELAYNAHKSLTQQIRFLSPLKLSGYQSRQKITGKNIHDHIVKFFGDRFDRQRVTINFGDGFLKLAIIDLPSRIYPVFTNIINNALYWVCLSDKRRIEIDLLDDLVIIANSGPAIDEDDIPKLFELFYSKRANGHGVGLYLCRENLAVTHHEIWYSDVNNGDPYIIKDGANFIIKFKGLEK